MSDQLARDIAALAELFKTGGWRELRVESNGISILLSIDLETPGFQNPPHTVHPEPVEGLPFSSQSASDQGRASTSSARTGEEESSGWVGVVAPNLGTFYRSPRPGAPPFVELGQRVTVDNEICLLEVMKLFTSVKAGVAGNIRRICADDAELVAGGQPLFYIEPERE